MKQFVLQARPVISALLATVAVVASVIDAFSNHGSIQFIIGCVALVGLAVMLEEPR